MFEDDYKAVNDALAPSSEAEQRTLASMRRADRSGKTPRRISVGLRNAIAACLSLLFAAPAMFGAVKLASKPSERTNPAEPTEIAAPTAAPAEDYSEVFAWLRPTLSDTASFRDGYFWYYASNGGEIEKSAYEGARATGAPTAVDGVTAYSGDHSDTNVQVEGVDESDIIKTDGRYIYVLNNEGVAVLKAEGADTRAVAHIYESEMPLHNEEAGRNFCGMYLANGKLIVIAQEYKHLPIYFRDPIVYGKEADTETNDANESAEPESTEECYYCFGWFRGDTMVYVFDIEDSERPERISALCVEGSFRDSRVTDGRLYIITSYSPDTEVYPNDPATYIPGCFDNDGKCELTSVSNIARIGEGGSYTYIAVLDIAHPYAFSDSLALLGWTNTLYCSGDSIYLTIAGSEEKRESVRFFIDDDGECVIDPDGDREGEFTSWYETTGICRVSLADGKPVLAAQGSVDGYCLNQFSLDEYAGYLRIAVTKTVNKWISVAEDEDDVEYYFDGFRLAASNPLRYRNEESSAVYVLNSDLVTVGRLEGLGEGELIKSVRFMGDIGYVVTFRQTDPLFSIDLSVPASPRVMGKLKIPGFSEYLHGWGDGLLFGFGQMADTETGGTQGIKLSMFDVSDPTAVKERACLHIENIDYSAAEYDHKAILVAPERGLIGFPAEYDSYAIYSYGEDGFAEKARIVFGDSDWCGAEGKGLYIGSCFYVIDVAGTVYVIDLNAFELTATVEF